MYLFISIPVKTTVLPGHKSNIQLRAPPPLLQTVANARTTLRLFFLKHRDAVDRGQYDAAFGTEQHRTSIVQELGQAISIYQSLVLGVVAADPLFQHCRYYYWSESLSSKNNLAVDDTNYDLANVHYNAAAIYMELSKYLVSKCNEHNVDAMEKEAYGYLCNAAGHYQTALGLIQKMASSDSSSALIKHDELYEDIKIGFLTMMLKVALAQAQEIGASKAFHNPDNKGKEIISSLSRTAADLYQEALTAATKQVMLDTGSFVNFKHVVHLKGKMFSCLAYSHASASRFDKQPKEGLYFLFQSQLLLKECSEFMGKNKKGMPPDVSHFFQACSSTVQSNTHRIEQLNNLVVREKAAEGPVDLPRAVVLAKPKMPPASAIPDVISPISLENPQNELVEGFVTIEKEQLKPDIKK